MARDYIEGFRHMLPPVRDESLWDEVDPDDENLSFEEIFKRNAEEHLRAPGWPDPAQGATA
jgi:hypothetical protein